MLPIILIVSCRLYLLFYFSGEPWLIQCPNWSNVQQRSRNIGWIVQLLIINNRQERLLPKCTGCWWRKPRVQVLASLFISSESQEFPCHQVKWGEKHHFMEIILDNRWKPCWGTGKSSTLWFEQGCGGLGFRPRERMSDFLLTTAFLHQNRMKDTGEPTVLLTNRFQNHYSIFSLPQNETAYWFCFEKSRTHFKEQNSLSFAHKEATLKNKSTYATL